MPKAAQNGPSSALLCSISHCMFNIRHISINSAQNPQPVEGDRSVGVARQWCGRLGKVDNCQVAVFAVLTDGAWEGDLSDAADPSERPHHTRYPCRDRRLP